MNCGQEPKLNMRDIKEITISQAHQGFEDGSFSVHDLTAAFLNRIDKLDKNGPKIHSTLAMSTTALDEANALDVYYKQHGTFKGPLHGIPILVKDQADTAGMITMYGSIAAKDNMPEKDAVVVKKLKDAGAVILGKTTMSEWASTWFSATSATNWVPTKNPYSYDRDVGGSSCGSAAGVAANFAILAVAEDTGGSVRCPASFCNLVGLRCTPGLVSRTGFCPLIKTQDTPGPMARTVTDCALMLDSMVGFDPEDEFTGINLVAKTPGGSYAAGLDSGKIKHARIGIVRELFGPDSDPDCKAVNKVCNAAIEKLSAAGTTCVDVNIEKLAHYMYFTPTYEQCSRADINGFLAKKPLLPNDIAEIVPVDPPKQFLSGTSKFAHGPLDPTSDPVYVKKLLARDEFQRKLNCLFASENLDALAFPDVQIPPPKHVDSENGRFDDLWSFPTNTLLASMARIPAITVPAGFTEDGLPVGLELVSWEYREKALFELALGVEAIVAARKAPPAPL